MKNRIGILLSVLLVTTIVTNCGITSKDMTYSTYERGYWGQWYSYPDFVRWAFKGNPDNFVVYLYRHHPSDFVYHIQINNYNSYRVSSGNFEQFVGTIEYRKPYNNYSSADFIHRSLPELSSYGDIVSRPAKISVKKESRHYVYNVFFDDVGFAVTIPWQKAK